MIRRTLTPCAIALLPALATAQGDAEKAVEEFHRAEKAVADGKYRTAVAIYERIAKRYPETPAGVVAQSRTEETAFLGWGELNRTGPSANRVDVVVMGDGYRLNDQNDFDDVAKSVVDVFRNHKVFAEYFDYHNFLRANLRSRDQGVTGFGREKDTALGGHISGHVQGQVGVDHGKCMAMLEQMPEHDGLAIAIVKAGSMGTGGGGVAAIGGRADDTMIHEWGHAFAGLSDEYSTFTGHRGSPRDTINISTTDDPKKVPWKHWIEAGAPGIGAYRGGDGRIKGVWKPTAGACAMEGGVIFCDVCREALVLRIYSLVDPIDACEPDADRARPIRGPGPFEFEVTILKPKTHPLEVSWWVLPETQAIRAAPPGPFEDRRKRGALAPIEASPAQRAANSATRHGFEIDKRELEPGRYQVVCRVRDDAKPSGQQWPWVLKDEHHLLTGERVWWILVE